MSSVLVIDFTAVIRQDAQDPDFQSMLRAMGAVQQQQQQIPQRVHLNSQVQCPNIICCVGLILTG